jgi:hypothetical protein
MSKFRDRIVLRDLVIPPEWVRIYAPRYGYVEYAMGENAPVHTIHFSECRIDPATGMVDRTGKEIFELDIDSRGEIVIQYEGEWVLSSNKLNTCTHCPLARIHKAITITGMVTWEKP